MATEYLDRNDNVISRERWKELRQDVSYVSVKRYDNGVVHLEVEWYGKIDNVQNIFDHYKKVYKVTVQNYTENGNLQKDGANGETWHRTEEEAITHYERFLLDWSDSEMNGGKFIEHGNTLKPINPDLPESEIVVPGFEGGAAW